MSWLGNFLRPHRTIPLTPWSASSQWDCDLSSRTVVRFLVLIAGLSIFGLGEALLLQSFIGNSPWSVLAQGISTKIGLPIGTVTAIISVAVLILWVPLKERPGIGTFFNIIVIPSALEVGLALFPAQHQFFTGLVYSLLGIGAIGVGSALYITCMWGPGPRDGLMTAVHNKTGIRVGRVRLTLEVIVFLIGWSLGGRIGLGTALFALLIGQSIAIAFGVVSRLTSR